MRKSNLEQIPFGSSSNEYFRKKKQIEVLLLYYYITNVPQSNISPTKLRPPACHGDEVLLGSWWQDDVAAVGKNNHKGVVCSVDTMASLHS